jgi:short-subunit dehydrogenase
MRAQQSGHIIQISSIGGVWTVPTSGLYHASKWGLEGFSQALAAEVKPFGIKVTIIEPGGFATEFGTTSAHRAQRDSCFRPTGGPEVVGYESTDKAGPQARSAPRWP